MHQENQTALTLKVHRLNQNRREKKDNKNLKSTFNLKRTKILMLSKTRIITHPKLVNFIIIPNPTNLILSFSDRMPMMMKMKLVNDQNLEHLSKMLTVMMNEKNRTNHVNRALQPVHQVTYVNLMIASAILRMRTKKVLRDFLHGPNQI